MNIEREVPPTEIEGRHLMLHDLREEVGDTNEYLNKINLPCTHPFHIPAYPKPEFHVNRLKHETTADGLKGIRKDGGFRVPGRGSKIPLMWWSLAVGPEEINDAEDRLLEETFPNRREVRDPEQQRFLWKFATSPAFKETSRVGSFRFTFSLEEVLSAYKEQFCSGAEPVMRVYKTVLYPQEVMYVVLVHSRDFNETFKDYPLLENNPEAICVYRDGHFIWRAQAMCETHWPEIKLDRVEAKAAAAKRHKFYVWDHFAVALHLEKQKVLKFGVDQLGEKLKYCEEDDVTYSYNKIRPFIDLDEARKLVSKLWANRGGPLEVEPSLQLSYPVTQFKLVLAGSNGGETMSTGNAILGRKAFTIIDPPPPQATTHARGTKKPPPRPRIIQEEFVEENNLVVRIINTPPLSKLKDAVGNKETDHMQDIRLSGPEVSAFLLVIKLQDISAEQVRKDVEDFQRKFKNKALRRTMIVFNLPRELQEILSQKVNNRYLVFNNNLDNRDPEMVSDLLNEVKNMIEGGD